MAKSKKDSVKRIEAIHVRKDGEEYQIVIGEHAITIVKIQGDEAAKLFFWYWEDVATELTEDRSEFRIAHRLQNGCEDPDATIQHGKLPPDPHAQPGGVPGVSSPKQEDRTN